MELNLLVQPVLFPVGLILFQKQLWFRETELIDALLHITHHKHIRRPEPLPGNTADQRLLDLVAVLVFVHKDLLVDLREFIRHQSRLMIQAASGEDFQRKMFQIIKVHQVFLLLRLLEFRRKLLRKFQKHQDRLPAGVEIREHLIDISWKVQCLHLLDAVLCEVPVGRCLFFLLRVHIFSPDSRQPSKLQLLKALRNLLVSPGFPEFFHSPDVFR